MIHILSPSTCLLQYLRIETRIIMQSMCIWRIMIPIICYKLRRLIRIGTILWELMRFSKFDEKPEHFVEKRFKRYKRNFPLALQASRRCPGSFKFVTCTTAEALRSFKLRICRSLGWQCLWVVWRQIHCCIFLIITKWWFERRYLCFFTK